MTEDTLPLISVLIDELIEHERAAAALRERIAYVARTLSVLQDADNQHQPPDKKLAAALPARPPHTEPPAPIASSNVKESKHGGRKRGDVSTRIWQAVIRRSGSSAASIAEELRMNPINVRPALYRLQTGGKVRVEAGLWYPVDGDAHGTPRAADADDPP